MWADGDPIIPPKVGAQFAERLGMPAPEILEGASHFLQEDRGELIGERIAAWLAGQA
jgi:pimeloyl-ACP methyl ester carboxylesterase